MNILIVSQHYYPENFRVTDIAENLVKLGNQVTVITGYPNYPEGEIYPGYKGKEHKDEYINDVHVLRCYEYPRKHSALTLFLNYYSICLSMKKKAKKLKENFDIVLINQTSPVMVAWAGIAYAKKHKVKCILYCYDLWPDSLAAGGIKKNSMIFKYYYRVSNRIYKTVDEIMYTSHSFLNYFTDYHGVSKEKLTYLPQYCEDLFAKVESNYNRNHFDFVFAGNVGKMQSVETIIQAANLLKNDESITFHIVGDGSNLKKCQQMVDELKLKNVVFYGKRPLEEMTQFYSLASAMIVSLTHNEIICKTLPGKVQSYMCAGKPIIACASGETKRIIEEAHCGLCCESDDYEALASIILQFKKMNLEEMSFNSKEFYKKFFDKEKFFSKIMERIEMNC